MSETEPPKNRRFWQLHLSTAVLLMLASGPIVWLNTSSRFAIERKYEDYCRYSTGWRARGWPFSAFRERIRIIPKNQPSNWQIFDFEAIKKLSYYEDNEMFVMVFTVQPSIMGINAVLDVLVAILILLPIASLLEWLIRRRECRKP
jgi:hypothetical protein